MTSVHFVVDFAFCIGVLLAFFPLYRKVSKLLTARLNKVKQGIVLPSSIQARSKNLLKGTVVRSHETEEVIAEILEKAYQEYDSIIAANKRDLENTLVKHLDAAVKKMSDQVSAMTQSLKLSAIDVAASAIQELTKEANNQNKRQDNNGIISTLDRDLRKKLH